MHGTTAGLTFCPRTIVACSRCFKYSQIVDRVHVRGFLNMHLYTCCSIRFPWSPYIVCSCRHGTDCGVTAVILVLGSILVSQKFQRRLPLLGNCVAFAKLLIVLLYFFKAFVKDRIWHFYFTSLWREDCGLRPAICA